MVGNVLDPLLKVRIFICACCERKGRGPGDLWVMLSIFCSRCVYVRVCVRGGKYGGGAYRHGLTRACMSSGKAAWDGPKYGGYPQHVKHIGSLSKDQIVKVIDLALKMKKDPHAYTEALKHRTLLALFEKPSLRTRVSLEIGMTQV